MKNKIAIILFIGLAMSCKKEDIKPNEVTPDPTCECADVVEIYKGVTIDNYFQMQWVIQSVSAWEKDDCSSATDWEYINNVKRKQRTCK